MFKNQARGTEEKGKKKEFINVSGLDPGTCLDKADRILGSASLRFPQEVHEQIHSLVELRPASLSLIETIQYAFVPVYWV